MHRKLPPPPRALGAASIDPETIARPIPPGLNPRAGRRD
jgi:hypothetical protein